MAGLGDGIKAVMPDIGQRIPRIDGTDPSAAVKEVFVTFGDWADTSRHHVITTFAQHPALATPFLKFNKHLLSTSTLPVRLRQIAILRVAWSCVAVYMWSSHMKLSLDLGLSVEDFEAVKLGAASPHWSGQERQIIDAVDRLRDHQSLDDRSWGALASFFDHQQMLDFLFTVGTYVALSMVFNSVRIEREPHLEELGDRLGVPVGQHDLPVPSTRED